jgi:hypothetical protein
MSDQTRVGLAEPDADYPPPGDKPAWAAWWERWNRLWGEVHAAAGTDPAGGLSDDERMVNPEQQV